MFSIYGVQKVDLLITQYNDLVISMSRELLYYMLPPVFEQEIRKFCVQCCPSIYYIKGTFW